MTATGTGKTTADELVIERVFDAPRELVWRAWTDPEHFVQWYGPSGFTVPHCAMDLRVGGSRQICMSHSEFGEMWSGGVFDEIDPPARLVYREYMTDAAGNKLTAQQSGMSADWPEETLTTLTFEDLGGGRTKMTLRWGVPSELAVQSGALVGWSQSFDKLAAYLAQS